MKSILFGLALMGPLLGPATAWSETYGDAQPVQTRPVSPALDPVAYDRPAATDRSSDYGPPLGGTTESGHREARGSDSRYFGILTGTHAGGDAQVRTPVM